MLLIYENSQKATPFTLALMGILCGVWCDYWKQKIATKFCPACLIDNERCSSVHREIFTVLDLMKMDMANFTIQQIRPFIKQQSVQYERKKFADFLKVQEGESMKRGYT